MTTNAIAETDYATWSTPELRKGILARVAMTAENLREAAKMWAVLDDRGEDLSDLMTGICYYVPLIYSGGVAAEAVVAFAGKMTLLKAVAVLPIEKQRELAAGGSVPFAVLEAGEYVQRSLPARALTAPQVRQVFGERHIRSQSEQIAFLTTTAQAGRRPRPQGTAIVDREKKTVHVGRATCPLADMLAAFKAAGYEVKDSLHG